MHFVQFVVVTRAITRRRWSLMNRRDPVFRIISTERANKKSCVYWPESRESVTAFAGDCVLWWCVRKCDWVRVTTTHYCRLEWSTEKDTSYGLWSVEWNVWLDWIDCSATDDLGEIVIARIAKENQNKSNIKPNQQEKLEGEWQLCDSKTKCSNLV